VACRQLEVKIDIHLANSSHLGDHQFRNREMICREAGLCPNVHRSLLDEASLDLLGQAIEVGIPTYLIDSDAAVPKQLLARPAGIR